MATSTLTAVNIVNQALVALGENKITALTDNTLRAQMANEHWPTVRDAVLEEHPWHFASVRTTLYAYTAPAVTLTPGAGATTSGTTGVTFTASSAAFASTDVGKQIRGTGVPGLATITGFTSTTVVAATIDAAFAGTAMASGSWRLFNAAPAWGYANSIPVPSDSLRIWRKDQNQSQFRVEGTTIVTDEEALNLLYTRQETDTTKYPPTFVRALVLLLAATFAE